MPTDTIFQMSSAGDVLAERVLHFMRTTDKPMGIAAFGYTAADIPRLVEGTLVQARLLKLSPIEPTAALGRIV